MRLHWNYRSLTIRLLCALLLGTNHAHAQKMDRRTEELIRQTVLDRLKDPDSAKFSNQVSVVGPDKVRRTCGYVNAKNSYGGYVGPRAYAVISNDGLANLIEISNGEEWHTKFILETCDLKSILISISEAADKRAKDEAEDAKSLCSRTRWKESSGNCYAVRTACEKLKSQLTFISANNFMEDCRVQGYDLAVKLWLPDKNN